MGGWRNPAAHLVYVQDVPGSSPGSPTILEGEVYEIHRCGFRLWL